MKIKCDKCGEFGVTDQAKYTPPEPIYSMEDIVSGRNEGSNWQTADIKWHTRILNCRNCGFSKEYEHGSGGLRPTKINL